MGKTALINEFCKDKPVIFFSALNASSRENLEALSKAIYMYKNPEGTGEPVYRSYADALEEITKMAKEQPLVFVIDEYPYLAKAEKSISSRLQHIIDHEWQESRLYFILCGSSMSFMEYQVLGYESPLYGRRTAQLKIQALNYREITAFHPELETAEQALLYGVTGGIPHYINKLDVEENLDDAILENLFNTSSYLFEEPENLLKQELREPAVYNSIIAAIADNFFRFWYRFVLRNMSIISSGRMRQVYDRAVKQHYSDYMGLIFEKMCQDYLLYYAQNLPILLGEIGQWWGTDSVTRKEVQIDIVGTPVEGKEYLIGSCKYKNEKIGVDELELLKRYASVFHKGEKYYYYIFSKGGFTPALQELGKQGEVVLLTLEDIYGKNN
ncbi:MAG: ATP-binding protein [Lachnospiraceae bacterium]|nr:ATP-binding protein [Lachnospiraceae bacterium]